MARHIFQPITRIFALGKLLILNSKTAFHASKSNESKGIIVLLFGQRSCRRVVTDLPIRYSASCDYLSVALAAVNLPAIIKVDLHRPSTAPINHRAMPMQILADWIIDDQPLVPTAWSISNSANLSICSVSSATTAAERQSVIH